MQSHHASTVVNENKAIVINNVPFPEGQVVDVIMRATGSAASQDDPYPLRGSVLSYIDPVCPVDEDEWEAASWSSWTRTFGSGGWTIPSD